MGIWRYFRLYAYFVRFSLSRSMEFRVDFFLRVIMDAVFYAVNIGFFKLIFFQTPVLAGWTEPQMMIFVASFLVMDGLAMTLFSNNLWMLPISVNKGDLDYYLLRPVSSLFFLSLREFAFNSFLNLGMALGILAWAMARYPDPLSAWRILGLLVMIGTGTFLYYILQMLFILPVFWTNSPQGWRPLFWGLTRLIEQPDRLFRGWVRRILVTVLPFSVMISFPIRLFLEPFDWRVLLHLTGLTGLFFALLCGLWRHALNSYSSASS